MKIKYTIQGLTAFAIATGIFLVSPLVLHYFDETAGTFDLGYLQRPLLAAAFFLFATFIAWLAFQIDWPDLDKYVDSDEGFAKDFKAQSGLIKIISTAIVFFLLLAGYLVCLALVPV